MISNGETLKQTRKRKNYVQKEREREEGKNNLTREIAG